MKTKKFNFKNLIWIIAGIILILGYATPNSGKHALLDELFNILIFWMTFCYFACSVIKNKVKSLLIILLIVIFVLFNIFLTSRVVLDVAMGTSYIEISNIKLTKKISSRLVSTTYYVEGIDSQGNTHIFLISKDDASRLNHSNEILIEYYPYTERVYKISYIPKLHNDIN